MTALLDQLSVVPARMRASAPRVINADPRAILRAAATSLLALALSTAGVTFLESPAVGIADASPLYLVAVVAVGVLHGTRAALATALAAFAAYDVLFTEPRLNFIVADPREWLDLLLLLFVALVIGVPLGIAAGRWSWTTFANQAGFVPESLVRWLPILITIPAAFVFGNLIATFPARAAARTRPAEVFRTE